MSEEDSMAGYRISVGGQVFDIEVGELRDGQAQVIVNGEPFTVAVEDVAAPAPRAAAAGSVAGTPLLAPMPGLIVNVRVRVGDKVRAGQIVAVMEAMKMENSLAAPVDGGVREIRVGQGTEVATGDVLMVFA